MAHAKGDRYQRDDTHKRKKNQAARDSKKTVAQRSIIFTHWDVCALWDVLAIYQIFKI